MEEPDYDVMVFVRWVSGYDPYKEQCPAIWKGEYSAIDIISLSAYKRLRYLLLLPQSPMISPTEIQLIKPKTANPTY